MTLNWNDARYLLAASRTGTLAGAAKATEVDATTVARRLAVLERAVGSRLFERSGGRLVLTAAGHAALGPIAEAERALRELEAAPTTEAPGESGTVRISAVGTLLSNFLLPRFGEFVQRHPNLRPELVAETAQADLLQHEADLALRMVRPDTGSLIVKRLCRVAYAAYAAPRLASACRGRPVAAWPWIAYEQRFEHLPEARWRRAQAPQARCVLRTTVGALTADAVSAGLGVAMLPCYVAAAAPDLQRLTSPVLLREIWLVTARSARRLPGVRAAHAWLSELFERERDIFTAAG